MKPRDLPPSARATSFSTTAAQLAGVGRARLRRNDLCAPFHGVRHPSNTPPVTLEERCRAYAQVMADGMLFSHTTAADLYGLPLPASARGVIHVAAPRPRRAPRAEGIVGHRITIAASQVRQTRGLLIPEPAQVFCQLGALLAHDDLVRAGDALVQRKEPLTTLDELRAAVLDGQGRPGIRTLRQAIECVRPRTDSPMETTLRLAIVRAGLPEPEINYRIHLSAGRDAYLDLAYPALRVAVEYDGDHHRTDDRQYHRDGDRLWTIESNGWRIIRVNRSHMANDAREATRRVRHALTSVGRNTP